jgi:hypothetical protein
MEAGNWYAALGDLQAYRADAGVRPEILLEEARCLRLADRGEDARATYERVFGIHMRAGRWKTAADVAEEMLRDASAGPHPRHLTALAHVLEREDDLFRAAVFFERAGLLEGDPVRSAETLEHAAALFRGQVGDLERAAQLLAEAAERLLHRRDTPADPATRARARELAAQSETCRRVLAHRMESFKPSGGSALAGGMGL